MKILVTGSSGHLGEALMRMIPATGHDGIGIDIAPSPFTRVVGTITDRDLVRRTMDGVDAVIHTATLHKPHVATHSRQDFVTTNVSGTLALLEAAVETGVGAFIFTSTTSTFGAALVPPAGEPAAWITEDVQPVPKNIYGVTKVAAEDLCRLFHRTHGLPCLILRTSRFFPEPDDNKARRDAFADPNAKANEFTFRRVDVEDAAMAHFLAVDRAPDIGFGRYIISATAPFSPGDLAELRESAPDVLARCCPDHVDVYRRRGWAMFPGIDRVYVNDRAREALGWRPEYDFARIVAQLKADQVPGSDLARRIGIKGYHGEAYADGLYPVD